jgi:TatD DNase family protein
MGWFDNHCHLDNDLMPDGTRGALVAARQAGVTGFIAIGTDRSRAAEAVAIAAEHDDVWATVGLHPHQAVEGVDTVVSLIDAPKVVAVGECGLDYHYNHSPQAVQRFAFATQIRLAHERALTLVIHTREAWDDTFELLRIEGTPQHTVLHCFTGGPVEARRALDLGAYLSFSGIITFKNADDIRAAAALCPADRLLVETDAPFLAPVPHRGRPNQPAYLPLVGSTLADVRGVNVTRVEDDTFANTRVAFRLPPP